MLKRLTIFIGIFILFCPSVSMAGLKEEFEALGGKKLASDYELRYLPPYCRCRAALNKDRYGNERKKWDRIFYGKGERGKDWIHVHHYCFGLLMLSRLNRGVGKRGALLSYAENQFNYVLRHSSSKFVLMPEIHLKMGITQKLMGRDSKSLQHFIQATKLKKNYVPAYIHIIDYYKKHHDFKNAIRTAKKGLKYSPNSKILKKELVELQSPSTTR
jgi:tetratricopeptide (TPR) repeat protein